MTPEQARARMDHLVACALLYGTDTPQGEAYQLAALRQALGEGCRV